MHDRRLVATMRTIVMFQGMGNNERGWARLVSKFGRVVMIQQGMIQHVEIWEKEQCLFDGAETSVMSTRKLDEITFSSLTACRCLARFREFTKGRNVDIIIAANYSMGLPALTLRILGKTRKVVVLLSDFLPARGSLAIRVYRRITDTLNRMAARFADEVWTVSPRIPTSAVNQRSFVVPICLNDNHTSVGDRNEIGYIGIPSADHALEILFEIGRRHKIRLNIIGDSAYLRSIKAQAPPDTIFHGMLNDQERIHTILSRCFCGYAVYRNTGPQSYSFFGVPSKTFYFLASNTPVVTTNTAHFTESIERLQIGLVVPPALPDIEIAILRLKAQFSEFHDAIDRFRKTWNSDAERFHQERLGGLWNPEACD